MSKKFIIGAYVVAFAIIITLAIYFRRYILPERLNDKIDDMNIKGNTETQIYNAAIERLARHFNAQQSKILAAFMVAQSKQESGADYGSKVAKTLNNVLGYKVYKGSPYQLFDKSLAAVDGGASAHYANVADCAREVADWIGRRATDFATVTTAKQYVDAMFKNGYTPMPYYNDYLANVTKFSNQMQNTA